MKNLFYQPRFFLILSIFFLTLFISPTFADAATYYVATNGNDSNPGTQASPWKTVVKGCNTVTTAGDTIHIVAGTYTESAQCFLAKGVNIEGEGKTTTIVKSTLTGLWSNYMELESPDGTNGSQSISNFTLDGNTNTSGGQSGTGVGIWITGRSNVSVHDMKLTNFYMSGTIFGGNHLDGKTAKNWTSGPYATGNTFYNNDGTNCAAMEGSIGGGSGCLMIGWQDGMQIHHNNLNTTARPVSHNGWPIKFLSNGYLKGVKIHDNTLIKSPFQGAGPWAPPDWDFAIEFFNVQGLELANNYIQGSVDVNYTYKGSYPYGLWAHGNTHNHAIGNYNHHEAAYVLEFKQDHVIIENNIINNKSVGITYNTRGVNNNGGENNYACTYGGSTGGCSGIINNVIRNNVFSNIYLAGGQPAPIVVISENEVNDLQMDGMHIYNNVISGRSGAATYNGIEFNGIGNGSSVKNVYIRNNIIQNFQGNPISVPSGGSQSNIHVTNNDFYNNASNAVSWPAAAQANNQTNINPLFVSATDFHLQATSPLIDDGFTPLALPSYAQAVPFNPTAPDLGAYETGTTSGNASPVANAGPDQAITLPTSTVTLTGTGTDSDGTITAYAWTKTAGPTAGTITNPASASTTVTGLAQGTYTFQLQVTDNLGATGIDTMNVVVSGVVSNPGNFATWNPLDKGAKVALSNSNMTAAWNGGKGTVRSTISKSSGKWYWEVKMDNAGNQFVGVANAGASINNTVGFDAGGWSIVVDDGAKFHSGNNGYWGTGFSNGDVAGVALDMDNGKITIYKNGALMGEMFSGLTGNVYAAWGGEFSGTGTANFGATPFSYAVPAGYNPGLYGSSSAPVFGVGTRVKTLARVAIRAGAGNNFVKLGIQQKDAVGTIIDGPANGSGYTWWKVDFDNAPDGWVQRQYLGNY